MRNKWFGDFDQCEKFSAEVIFNGKVEKWNGSYFTIDYTGLDATPEMIGSFSTAFCASPRCSKFLNNRKKCKIKNIIRIFIIKSFI